MIPGSERVLTVQFIACKCREKCRAITHFMGTETAVAPNVLARHCTTRSVRGLALDDACESAKTTTFTAHEALIPSTYKNVSFIQRTL